MFFKKVVFSFSAFFTLRSVKKFNAPSLLELNILNTLNSVNEVIFKSPGGSKSVEANNTCCICLSRLEGGSESRSLPCTHEFHRTCIDSWLMVCRKTCPICRYSLQEEEEKSLMREELTDELVNWFSSFHIAGY
ncbi:hypothetical protein LIER_21420 [Lithospermum erythrorhizon]|uniref:RING-type E3 ubiquitin transferase n=1 Tax=Lithospermum erythrorhizon TaxID=34254 RepID=A0AAV3QT29_LITER